MINNCLQWIINIFKPLMNFDQVCMEHYIVWYLKTDTRWVNNRRYDNDFGLSRGCNLAIEWFEGRMRGGTSTDSFCYQNVFLGRKNIEYELMETKDWNPFSWPCEETKSNGPDFKIRLGVVIVRLNGVICVLYDLWHWYN